MLKRNENEKKDQNIILLVVDEENNIAGIAETNDGSTIKPKVVFNAKG